MLKEWISIGIDCLESGAIDPESWRDRMRKRIGLDAEQHLPDIRQWSLILRYQQMAQPGQKCNCWDFMHCGQGGRKQCPVSEETGLDRIHGGTNGGRACWAVDGTVCGGKQQGTAEEKRDFCSSCRFYLQVRKEIGPDLLVSDTHLRMLLS